MQSHSEVVQDRNGNAQKGAKVLVQQNGANAFIYSDNGVSRADNPLTTDDNGTVTFSAADGKYDLSVNGTYIRTVLLFDSTQAAFNIPGTGQFFSQNNPRIQRFGDRLMVGDATVSDLAFPNIAQDWLTQFQLAAGLSAGAILSAQAASLTSSNAAAAVGHVAGAQSLHFSSAGASAIGQSAYALNNHSSLSTLAWAFYGEAHKTTAASGPVYAMELDTRTLFSAIAPTPFQQGSVIGLQLASGAGLSGVGQFDASAAIEIASNPVKFQAGIVFGATSITGTDGVTGAGVAMALAKGHTLAWYTSDGGQSATVQSQVTSSANLLGLQMNDNGFQFSGPSGVLGYWFRVNSAANYPFLSPSTTGNAVVYGAGGSDTNIDLQLSPQGSGVVKFGSYAAGAFTPAGYITIKDASGTPRRLLVG